MIRLQDIWLTYAGPEEVVAVKGVSLHVPDGEFLALVGPSGSGKSSLLGLMSGLKCASRGEVWIDETPYSRLSEAERAQLRLARFGFVFQQHFLLNYLTAAENVMLMVPKSWGKARRLERSLALLEAMGLDGAAAGRFPYQLSGGQRQRVAVARALANEPAAIFADEPTASLDHANGHVVVDLLARHRGKTTLVLVTHDREMLEGADRVIEMRDGTVMGA